MTENDPKPWEPLSQYSWMREREALMAEKRRRLENGEFELDERGNQKLEFYAPVTEVIRFAKYARNHEEYWQARQKSYEWFQRNPDYTGREFAHFHGFFCEWYRMKYDLNYKAIPFMAADRLLGMIIAKKMPDDLDSTAAREFLLKDPSIKNVN